MYGFIWRHLPGPRWLKFIEAVIIIVAIVACLFHWVYPWMVLNLPMFSNTVGN